MIIHPRCPWVVFKQFSRSDGRCTTGIRCMLFCGYCLDKNESPWWYHGTDYCLWIWVEGAWCWKDLIYEYIHRCFVLCIFTAGALVNIRTIWTMSLSTMNCWEQNSSDNSIPLYVDLRKHRKTHNTTAPGTIEQHARRKHCPWRSLDLDCESLSHPHAIFWNKWRI